ncbi:unnamed protein product [Adineta ricciae]|uniref:Uncharacterized protein n=1 Tax=Adineta ricciae TaxID=249248 RepID=A0A813Z5H7_ADIRI|nr:unnamed protein product [Adineta ricciae]CAF1151685.1 unnamed protein product [Adineta ricciae]
MDEVKKKCTSTDMNDENAHDNLFNLQRLKDGYVSIADKLGHSKFKPYLQRLFQSVEMMLVQEVTEFKKIDAKYQDMVRQCHIYEKTLTTLKESNSCELSAFSESSNTYALDDLTKVTPYLAPDLLQSTLGTGNAGGSTSIQFRLPRRRSSLSTRQFVSTPLGPTRTIKPAVPLAHFDDESSLILTNSLGFQQQAVSTEKQFVDAYTEPEPFPTIEQKDFSCQITPSYADKDIETTHLILEYQSTQTETILTETIACQINPSLNDCSMQTILNEQKDFSCQMFPTTIDQITETIITDYHTQIIQTDAISTNDYSCQITPEYVHQQIETNSIETQDIALQISFDNKPIVDDQQIQTDTIVHIDGSTQYDPEVEPSTPILPIVFSEELPISNEIEILLTDQDIQTDIKTFFDQECQTINSTLTYSNECTQTPHVYFNDCASQSTILTYDNQNIQTEPDSSLYSSSLFIVPTETLLPSHSSTVLIMPKEVYSSPIVIDQALQCDLGSIETIIPIEIERPTETRDRRSLIQHQMDEKEKQMNRIIEEYAMLYGEYETERRRNMDLTEARDRLADHIKVLSDELGDREINQEKLLIKSCQQNKLINYMLPQIDCSPMLKKKHNSASSFRRLLPKFK